MDVPACRCGSGRRTTAGRRRVPSSDGGSTQVLARRAPGRGRRTVGDAAGAHTRGHTRGMGRAAGRDRGGDRTPSGARAAGALVALQLVARGYSPEQIAGLRGVALVEVLWDLQHALTALRAATV